MLPDRHIYTEKEIQIIKAGLEEGLTYTAIGQKLTPIRNRHEISGKVFRIREAERKLRGKISAV